MNYFYQTSIFILSLSDYIVKTSGHERYEIYEDRFREELFIPSKNELEHLKKSVTYTISELKKFKESLKNPEDIDNEFIIEVGDDKFNDILSCENGHYIIGAKSYNQKIAKGQTISFGMIAYGKNQKPTMPSKITLGEEEKEEEQATEIEDSSLPKQYQALSYAVLSGGNNTFSLATNETYIGGNVHSNGGFTNQGTKLTIEGILETVSNIEIRTSSGTDCEKVEKKQENTASLSIPDLSKGIKE